jgi:uncharacterized DUF497 family protein
MPLFSWNDWNVGHIASHGVLPEEAEEIVRGVRPPFPRDAGEEKYLVWGQTSAGRYLQVIYILPDDEDVDVDGFEAAELLAFMDGETVIYVVHAMDMTARQKTQYRKNRGH